MEFDRPPECGKIRHKDDSLSNGFVLWGPPAHLQGGRVKKDIGLATSRSGP